MDRKQEAALDGQTATDAQMTKADFASLEYAYWKEIGKQWRDAARAADIPPGAAASVPTLRVGMPTRQCSL